MQARSLRAVRRCLPFRRARGEDAVCWTAWVAAAIFAVGSGGCGPARGGSAGGTPAAPAPPRAAAPIFRNAAREAGIDFHWGHGGRSPLDISETLGHGAAFIDYDRDGLPDAFVVGNRRCALFRNLGGGRFRDVSRETGLTTEGNFYGVAAGDYDNDGYPDLYVTGYGKCVLYHNTGRGGFRDATAGSGVATRGPYDMVTAAAFADFDGDGKLDLFAGRYIRFTPETIHFCFYHGVKAGCGVKNYDPAPPRVYRNTGGGTFTDATREWGFGALHGRCLGVAVCAAEPGRGVMLYSANDELPGDLMVREGGRYRNVGVESGTAYNHDGLTQGGMGVDWGDFDNDGRPDLVVGTFQNEPDSLYRNQGGGIFAEMAASLGVAAGTTADVAWTTKFFDYDNDGWLDLLVTNGHSQDNAPQIERDRTYPQPMHLYHNDRGRLFRDLGPEAGPAFGQPIVGRGAAFGDYDNDGLVDALVVDEEGSALLLHNECRPAGHWLGLRLEGRPGNRDAIGARVSVTAAGHTWVRDQQMGGGYFSSHDPRIHFGLGDASRVEKIVVRWPDGRVDTIKDAPADTYLRIREGEGAARPDR